jgi:hypothetical protein
MKYVLDSLHGETEPVTCNLMGISASWVNGTAGTSTCKSIRSRSGPEILLKYFSTCGGVQLQARLGSDRDPQGHFRISSVPGEPFRLDMRSESVPRNRIAWQPETPMIRARWADESFHEAIVSITGSRLAEGRPAGMRARAGIVSMLGMLLEPR